MKVVVNDLIKLADTLDIRGHKIEANYVDQLIITAGIWNSLKSLVDDAKTAAIKKAVDHLKDLVKNDPVKVAKYIIGLTIWLTKVAMMLNKLAPKKAMLTTSRDWLATLRDVAVIAAALLSIIHGLADNPKLTQQMKESLVKTKDVATTVTHIFRVNGFEFAVQHESMESKTEMDSKIPKSQYEKELAMK